MKQPSATKIIIKVIITEGDRVKDKRLSEIGGKGLFYKNIEKELIDEKIDIVDIINIPIKLIKNIFAPPKYMIKYPDKPPKPTCNAPINPLDAP